ncbi:MAG: Zn-dependent hydrolase [Acidimicrobiales bacterium]
MTAPAWGNLRIDIERLLGRLADLAAIGAIDGTEGCGRLALTDDDKAGRDLVAAAMRDLGLDVTIDGIGNVVGVLAGQTSGAPVMCGSHIDTVQTGGRYDGNLGVLAGLEVIEVLQTAGITPYRPLAVGFFTNEEGARFAPDMLGSLVRVGGLALESALEIEGIDGAIVGDELQRIGYDGSSPLPAAAPHAFVELHIEQGPVLEAEGVTIGAVTGVQGISWQEITVTGQSNHAGTTPMNLRRDPGYVAAACSNYARELALDIGAPQVATVGRIELHPNLVNVVPATATFTIDLRNTDEAVLKSAERSFSDFLATTAEAEKCTVETKELARFEPVVFDESVIGIVAATAIELGNSVKRMPSGAGHDAQMMARVCPTAMIFTQSRQGISHNPAEYTSPADLEAGANVLLQTLLKLSGVRHVPNQPSLIDGREKSDGGLE